MTNVTAPTARTFNPVRAAAIAARHGLELKQVEEPAGTFSSCWQIDVNDTDPAYVNVEIDDDDTDGWKVYCDVDNHGILTVEDAHQTAIALFVAAKICAALNAEVK